METDDHSFWNFPLVFISNQKGTIALKTYRKKKKKSKEEHNIEPRFVCLGSPVRI